MYPVVVDISARSRYGFSGSGKRHKDCSSFVLVSYEFRSFWCGWFYLYLFEAPLDSKTADLLSKFLTSLPLKKLTANQAFDLVADLVMVILVAVAFFADLGPQQDILKPAMIFYSLLFITWSAYVNRE